MENRSVIVAEYKVYSTFVIPEGIDIHDIEQVEEFWVKYDVLHIAMKDGREITVEPYMSAKDYDFKRPDDTTFESAVENVVDEDYKDEDFTQTS
jgi:hypothetical protein